MKNNYSVKELIKGIKQRDNAVFQYIYKVYYPVINQYIISIGGDENDAKDIFQESLIVIYNNVVSGKLKYLDELKPYLFGVSKMMYRKKLEISKKLGKVALEPEVSYVVENIDDKVAVNALKSRLLYKHFKRLGEQCQKILKMFAQKVKMEVIAKKFGFTNGNTAKKRKHLCQKELIDFIKNDIEYEDTFDY